MCQDDEEDFLDDDDDEEDLGPVKSNYNFDEESDLML